MDVSIIIVNYNTFYLTRAAIESVFEKTEDISYEVIVVDNNSPDSSGQRLKDFFNEKIVYLQNIENMGFGQANNEAAKLAKGRNLFFLNSDTILLNNAVKILSDYLDDDPHVGCCGGNTLDGEGRPNHSFSRERVLSIFSEINELFLYIPSKIIFGKNYDYNHSKKPLKVSCIVGADLMIRKEVFEKLNGFDTDFFMYHEEAELQHRVSKMGFELYSVPYAIIIHFGGKSFSSSLDRQRRMYHSRNIYLQKTHNLIEITVINTLFFLKVISRILLFTILRNKTKKIYWTEMYFMFKNKTK